MKSMLEHNFGYAGLPDNVQRSTFVKPYRYKGTFDADKLIPVFRQMAYPGDEMSVSGQMYCRLLTPMFPIMDDIILETFYFEVPQRLVWEHWNEFFGEVRDPISNPTTPDDFNMPDMDTTSTALGEDSFWDHLGCNCVNTGVKVNACWSRAYNLIWNEWFRDQDLQDMATVDIDDGPDSISDYPLQKANKKHDYFTACRPTPQKFDEVVMPLGSTAPVIGNGESLGLQDEHATTNYGYGIRGRSGHQYLELSSNAFDQTLPYVDTASDTPHEGNAFGLSQNPDHSGVIADLSAATSATINDLRQAIALQQMNECMSRVGSRYTEQVFAMFRVVSPDARQQRPVFLGSAKQYINVHENRMNTSNNTNANGVADTMNLGGYLDVFSKNGFRAAFTEHSMVIGLCVLRGAQSYQQGIPKWLSLTTRDDFYNPFLADLGEQPVLNAEIYAQGTSADDDAFGYIGRWDELRYNTSVIAGQFKSDHSQPLDAWHLAQDFATLPVLGSSFIESNLHDILDRCTELTNQPDVMMDALFRVKVTTQMPVRSVPGMERI